MRGFYQFKDNNYYNKPDGPRPGLSIFPYQGLLQNIPYSMGIPIARGRYSKSTLDGNNSDVNGARQQNSGPLPYIYKLRLSGLSSKFSCNAGQCEVLNDRDFYLYGVDKDLLGVGGTWRASWIGMFNNDSYPNGIYIRDKYGDNIYDLIVLTLIESSDFDVDKSYLILTLGSSLTYNIGSDTWSNGVGVPTNSDGKILCPFLFYKEFAADERIFALEESIDLTSTTEITIDNGSTSYILRAHNDAQVCNFAGATGTLTPYQTETYDIYNNHNAYGDLTNNGLMHDRYPYVEVVTSSGTINVDKFFHTSNLRLLESPGGYKLTIARVSTDQQGNHVPCETFFNREFYLKGAILNALDDTNLIDRNGHMTPTAEPLSISYSWDNYLERQDIVYQLGVYNNYIGLTAHNATEPYLDNISLRIAGTGNFLELMFSDGNINQVFGGFGNTLKFRHPYNTSQSLRTTTFNNWTFHSDDSLLRQYCNFDNVLISLEPTGLAFQQGKDFLSCAPLCNDGTIPISANIQVRISGYIRMRQVSGFGFERLTDYPYDQTLNVITDVESYYFHTDGVSFVPNSVPPAANGNILYFGCANNNTTTTTLYLGGGIQFPTQTIEVSGYKGEEGGGMFIAQSGSKYYYFDGLDIYTSRTETIANYSGCPTRIDCNLGILLQSNGINYGSLDGIQSSGLVKAGGSHFLDPGQITGYTVNLAATGIITFDGFL